MRIPPVSAEASIPTDPDKSYVLTYQSDSISRLVDRPPTSSSVQYRDPAQLPPSTNSVIASSLILPPSTTFGSRAPPGQAVFFRMLRRLSLDGGVRLADGSPSEVAANVLPPEQ
ncbi:hypothetical protein BD311DRAFT_763216 [Dichomitus squalens]|uniref:Uncharacterized protein n=1 Tax=Dichomitus squalens TaxID=114155 RepID=A0A4Q9MFR6_9APHY|nr:hypothetical protein BD311DRAFT_763216 [Dichomitus squalens]